MDMNPEITEQEKDILHKTMALQGKHILTKSFGDGEINMITRKNDLSGVYVYFHSNREGEIKLDGEEFLNDIETLV